MLQPRKFDIKITEDLAKIGSKIGRAKQIFGINILVIIFKGKCQKLIVKIKSFEKVALNEVKYVESIRNS